MSVCAVSMCRDECDVIEAWARWTATQVDEILVADNLSSDGTRDILDDLARELPLVVVDDPDPAYFQSVKMSALARRALARGHQFGVFMDSDEAWRANDFRPVRDWLAGLAPDVQVVTADLFHHVPSGLDPPGWCDGCQGRGTVAGLAALEACPGCAGRVQPNAFARVGWRKRERAGLPKVAARLRPDLVVHAGNHGASTSGTGLSAGGLVVHHFSWRTPERYVRKIRTGEAAYALTDLPEGIGSHWRMWAGKPDDAVAGHFNEWFWSRDPRADDTLIYDPAPFELCGVSPALRWPERTAR